MVNRINGKLSRTSYCLDCVLARQKSYRAKAKGLYAVDADIARLPVPR